MRLPQDIANLLATAIRDAIWFKNNVRSYLEECGVPRSVMVDVQNLYAKKIVTIKVIHHVLSRLAEQGEEGFQITRKMLSRMYYWQDVTSLPQDRRDTAVSSLKALRTGFKKFEAQSEYQRDQEKKAHAERVARTRIQEIDHERLRRFRDEFDRIHRIENRSERGNSFEKLMNEIFEYYAQQSEGSFNRKGEQIDGLFYFDNHWYYVEIRWREDKANAADISVLRDRAKAAYGGDTKALFISFNGFTEDCLECLASQSDERVILMDGFDLRCVLDCQIALDVLMAEKQVELVKNKRAFVSAQKIVSKKQGA